MIRTAVVGAALVAGLLTLPAAVGAASPDAAQAAGQITAADAAPFVGNWTLTLDGPNGPASFELSVKVDQDKAVGEIKSAELPAQPITDITKASFIKREGSRTACRIPPSLALPSFQPRACSGPQA